MKLVTIVCVIAGCFNTLAAQTSSAGRKKLVLVDIDTRDFQSSGAQSQQQITAITRLGAEKLDMYNVVNQYDIEYLIKRDTLDIRNCFSTYCISDIGKKLECDYILTGSISSISEKIVIVLKVYNTASKDFDKQIVKEYMNFPLQITKMIQYTLREMHGLSNNTDETKSLTNQFEFDEVKNNPYKSRLRSDGPRMGLTYFTGETASILQSKKQFGGYSAQPIMFQFGYQFEKQYLNEGNFQALFEFLPMITGLDQGLFIPSFTILNGLRNNKNGWEFAFGPSFALVTKAKGFTDVNGNWILADDSTLNLRDRIFETRMDSRGEVVVQPSFIFAAGKTFKSGKLNIPVNGYFIPSKDGFRVGLSFGFNSRSRFENH